jgi:hypothetical protein
MFSYLEIGFYKVYIFGYGSTECITKVTRTFMFRFDLIRLFVVKNRPFA